MARVHPPRHSDSGPYGARRSAVLLYLPPIVLVVVAVSQSLLSHTHDLTPWKGGGFGMFSSVDSPTQRFVRAFVTVDGREIPVSLPAADAVQQLVTNTKTLPAPRLMNQLADVLSERRVWHIDPATGAAVPGSRDGESTGGRIHPSAIRIEVHRVLFVAETLEVERLLLAEVTRTLQ